MLKGHLLWVEFRVVFRVRRLVPEKIAVGPGVVEPLIALPAALAQGQRDRAFREPRLDL